MRAGGVAAIALVVAAAVALPPAAPASPLMNNAAAVGPGPADADGFIGLAAAAALDGTGAGAPGPGQLGRGGPGDHGGQLHAITIAAVNGSNLSLKTEDGWTRTITVGSDTAITKAGVAIQVADLKEGDTIAFRQSRNTDGTFKVVEIRVIVPQVGGTVTAVGDTSLTLRLRDGTSRTVTVNGSTRYLVGSRAATKADVKVGSAITAQGSLSGDTFTAISVMVRPDVIAGEVTAKAADSITLKTRDGASVTVKVDSSTTYRIAGKDAATLADVTVGMQLAAEGSRASDTTFNAFSVGGGPVLRPVGPGGPGRPGGPGGLRGPGGLAPNASPTPGSSTGAS
jgi:hypothetical protein